MGQSETLELILPLAYLSLLVLLFHSSNAELMGNVRSNHYHYKALEDLSSATVSLVLLALLDSVSLLAASIFLETFRGINMWHAFSFVWQADGLAMIFQHAFMVMTLVC